MKKQILLFAILSIFLIPSSYAQFKQIEGTKGAGEPNAKIKPSIKVKPNKVDNSTPILFKNLDISDLTNRLKTISPVSYNNRNQPIAFKGEITSAETMDLLDQAARYLQVIADHYNIDDIQNKIILTKHDIDELGMDHLTYQLVQNNIPVDGYEIKLHAKNQIINMANGLLINLDNINTTTPSFDSEEAHRIMNRQIQNQENYVDLSQKKYATFKVKQIQSDLVIAEIDGTFKLVYRINAYTNLIERNLYYLDAQTGKILSKQINYCKFHDHSHTNCEHSASVLPPDGPKTANAKDLQNITRNINTYQVGNKYYLIDASRSMFNASASNLPNEPVGVIWTIDAFNTNPENNNFQYDNVSSNNNTWSSKTAVSAHYNGGKAYEYFKNTFSRNSINGEGGNIISLINVSDKNGQGFDNAFWNGQAMFYGNGKNLFKPLAGALDVAGHEMSHGVVQTTANLKYQGESGAINESMADIFGVMIDRDDWKLGEDVVTSAFPSGALRDMQDPHNGGNQLGDPGYQPKHVNEQYTGSQDNGGVHINSGIPNHAFYLFATKVGKDKAERVYYRALTKYLTKSSQFKDLRVAVEQSCTDLYDANVKKEASDAFTAVGIGGGGTGNNYEEDINENPGNELILYVDANKTSLLLNSSTLQNEPIILSDKNILSKPSATDNGERIVFVGQDKLIYIITIDWGAGTSSINTLSDEPVWRNVAISKDGKRIAALTSELNNTVIVYDFGLNSQKNFTLYNPTFTEGVSTGDVDYADAMTFDFSGDNLIYDAKSTIKGAQKNIEYWDIGFMEVFTSSSNSFGNGNVQKLFNQLPEGTSIGNPALSKNSPYIIAFDYLNGSEYKVLGANIETNQVTEILQNNVLSFPDYNKADDKLVLNYEDSFGKKLITVNLDETKLNMITGSATAIIESAQLGQYMFNGERPLTDISDLEWKHFEISPNPTRSHISISSESNFTHFQIFNNTGQLVKEGVLNKKEISVKELRSGIYFVRLTNDSEVATKSFIKQ